MKFSDERKQTIKKYILEKISQKVPSVSKTVAEAFDVNPSTVHTYINELVEEQAIRKLKRNEYELVTNEFSYELKRSAGELEDDTYAFRFCLSRHITGFAENVKNIWSYAFSEMINNVMDHSQAEKVSITVMQNYMVTKVLIHDNGIGIFRKIQEYFDLETLEDAICELVKGKLTTDKANHSGEGIFFSSKLMDDFYIASSGKIFTTNKYDDSSILDLTTEAAEGTCVFMALSNFSNKNAKDIFDTFANGDGVFDKTKIPLKNIFDDSPVSRSQAKRVCNRLDSFKEVIVDFEGISWMGQGFAHQLFVVFAKEHPEIRLTPVNMNEDITKMYNHVRASGQS